MKITPLDKTAAWLLHAGTLALSQASDAGVPVDIKLARSEFDRLRAEATQIEADAFKTKEGRFWRKKYSDASLGNVGQVKFMVSQLGLTLPDGEEAESMDRNTLKSMEHPLIKSILRYRTLDKMTSTFLMGVIRETVNGTLHPHFLLNLVRTYRSSSQSPNFQNMPIRDPEMGKIIRSLFISLGIDWHIVEMDESGAEVRFAACDHKDTNMLSYLMDDSRDMHRDCAQDIYFLNDADWKRLDSKIAKNIRYCAKNKFVFPAFYGSYWKQMAPALWNAINEMKLKGPSGEPLDQWLKSKGINGLGKLTTDLKGYDQPEKGTFYAHVKRVERDFWEERFPEYNQWKKDCWEDYQKKGWFKSLTGFRYEGLFRRNEVLNYRTQGAAFHSLLYTFIRNSEEIRKRKMKSYQFGQIHDSTLGMVHRTELQEYLDMGNYHLTVELPKKWTWINVPLKAEVDVSPAGGNWFQKEEWIQQDGIWIKKPAKGA